MTHQHQFFVVVPMLSALVSAASGDHPDGHERAVTSVSYSRTGMQVVSSGVDKAVVLWDVQTARPLRRLDKNDSEFALVLFGPGVTGVIGASNTAKQLVGWDPLTFREKWCAKLPAAVNELAFSLDGKAFAAACADGSIPFWESQTGAVVRKLIDGHHDSVVSLDFSPDGLRLATASKDGRVGWWNLHTFACEAHLTTTGTSPVKVVFLRDGTHLIVAWSDHSITAHPIENDAPISAGRRLGDHVGRVTAITVSPDSKWVATASADRTIGIWPLDNTYVPHRLRGHTDIVFDVEYAPTNGSRLCSASGDGTVRFWIAPRTAVPETNPADPFAP